MVAMGTPDAPRDPLDPIAELGELPPGVEIEDFSGLDDRPKAPVFRCVCRWDKQADARRVTRAIHDATRQLAQRLARAGYDLDMGDLRQRRWIRGLHAYWEVSWQPKPVARAVGADQGPPR